MRRGAKSKPNLLTSKPKPPVELDASEREIFEAVVNDLDTQGTLVSTDSRLIADYARTQALVLMLKSAMSPGNLTSTSSFNKVSGNPLLDKYLAALKLSTVLLGKMGLTPGTRPKTTKSSDEADSGWMA